ncbi:MAG: hypothetical protein FWC23_07355 [Chitinispirillia bacterium]|nr:hypothetical protein [Chitinispirillia bacterium]MCL2268985.1 hypothetical protein [Chitinispirillia bacterium]
MRFLLLPIFLLVVPICSIALRTIIRMDSDDIDTDDDSRKAKDIEEIERD